MFFKKSIILPLPITLLIVLLSNSICLSSFGEVAGAPKPTDPSYYIWYQHYFQGNADGMNNNTKPGPHDQAYNKGWKDGYQSVYGVYFRSFYSSEFISWKIEWFDKISNYLPMQLMLDDIDINVFHFINI